MHYIWIVNTMIWVCRRYAPDWMGGYYSFQCRKEPAALAKCKKWVFTATKRKGHWLLSVLLDATGSQSSSKFFDRNTETSKLAEFLYQLWSNKSKFGVDWPTQASSKIRSRCCNKHTTKILHSSSEDHCNLRSTCGRPPAAQGQRIKVSQPANRCNCTRRELSTGWQDSPCIEAELCQ